MKNKKPVLLIKRKKEFTQTITKKRNKIMPPKESKKVPRLMDPE